MELQINKGLPLIMHIDLNSCFATVTQQAYMHYRGKPLVVAAYTSPGGCVLSPSIEAKKLGIKVGMRVKEARSICSSIIVCDTDPALVRDVHVKFKKIFQDYSPHVFPKSIDEAVIDFTGTPVVQKRSLRDVGHEIKKRMRSEIGEWISCNIGISTNRFLAKLAAGLHKPDGLDIIDHTNLLAVYKSIGLTDLNGINVRYEARLNEVGIFNPLEFFQASEQILRKQVFKSIVGYYWYKRLRGWEVDDFEPKRKSFGQEYSLKEKTKDVQELSKILMKLCEKMGRRLRHSGFCARGIHVGVLFEDFSFWHKGHVFESQMYATIELYRKALMLLHGCVIQKKVRKIAVSCFDILPHQSSQMALFEDFEREKIRKVSDAVDQVNDMYGEFCVVSGIMMDMEDRVIDRIAFGGVKELK